MKETNDCVRYLHCKNLIVANTRPGENHLPTVRGNKFKLGTGKDSSFPEVEVKKN